MTIKIQRGRQFAAGDASVAVFEAGGQAGTYLSKAAEKLVAQGISVKLGGRGGLNLGSAEEWGKFLTANVATREQTAAFASKFGITFQDFLNVIDDAAASEDKGLTLDLRPRSEFAKQLSLDKVDNDYAKNLAVGAKIDLTGENGAVGEAVAAGVPSIGPEILATPVSSSWERDRTEQESWADFRFGNGASKKFKDNTGPAPFAKLTKPQWSDEEAMKLADRFTLPLHLEEGATQPDGTVTLQDKDEMFRETYFDDRSGTLGQAGASVRARVRFDDKEPYPVRRVLIQAKEGRAVDEATGRSAVHKFEKRFEGNSTSEAGAQALLTSGKDSNGQPLAVSQKLYQLAKDKGALPEDGQLRLEPKYTVLQKRRRTHLQLESSFELKSRREGLQKELDALTAAGTPVDPKLTAYAAKLDGQLKFLTEAGDLLKKYNQWMPSGECFIISADRYSVYDPAARKDPPNDIDDETGRIGRGLHVEAEWDSAASDPFEKALKTIEERLTAATPPANQEELEKDRAGLEAFRETFRQDVETTVALLRDRLVASGLELDPTKKAKDERAAEFAASPNRPVFWP